MDRISMLRAFTRLVERGSFTAVAQELRVRQSTVSKWLRTLEDGLGAQLIDRTTRAVRVTDVGRGFYERALKVLSAYDAAVDDVMNPGAPLHGRVRVAVPQVLGRLFVLPHLTTFLREHPHIELSLYFEGRYVRLVEEGFDLAVRVGRPVDSSLRNAKLATTARRLVACPRYLEVNGRPNTPRALAQHQCLGHSGAVSETWSFARSGRTHRVAVCGRVSTDNSAATLSLVRSGLGIGLLASWLVDDDVRAGRLEVLLPEYRAPPAPVRALTPPGRHTDPRVRALIEHLRRGFADRDAA